MPPTPAKGNAAAAARQAAYNKLFDQPVSSQSMLDAAPSKGRGTYLKIPDGWPIKWFVPQKNMVYKVMFLPWIAGKYNPAFKEGTVATNCYIPVHRNIGPAEEHFICPARRHQGEKPCPICEAFQRMRQQGGDWDSIKGMKYKDRELWFMHILEQQDQRNLFVWDESVALFGDAFRAKVRRRPQYMQFATLMDSGGCIVEFEAKEKPIGKQTCVDCTLAIEIEPRTHKVPAWIKEACSKYCIDKLVVEQTYEKLEKLVSMTGGAEEPEEPEHPADSETTEVVDEIVEDAPTEETEEPAAVEEETVEEEQIEEEPPAEEEEVIEEQEEVIEDVEEPAPAEEEIEEPEEPEPAPPPRRAAAPARPASKPAQRPAAQPAKPANKPAQAPARPGNKPPSRPSTGKK